MKKMGAAFSWWKSGCKAICIMLPTTIALLCCIIEYGMILCSMIEYGMIKYGRVSLGLVSALGSGLGFDDVKLHSSFANKNFYFTH